MSTIPQHILQANSSLTLALEAFYHGTARICVLSEKLRCSSSDEKMRIQLSDTLWERQILLYIADKPVLYGLTRVGEPTLAHFSPRLDELGTTPLGYWLFQQKSRKRIAFGLSTLDDSPLPHADLHPDIQNLPSTTLTRESLHLVDSHPISVVEFILV